MSVHGFSFDGGDILSQIGASWFVSYAYHETIDPSHLNWKLTKTANTRLSKYNKGKYFHRLWLQEVLKMQDNNLNKNSIGLDARQVKFMAQQVLCTYK